MTPCNDIDPGSGEISDDHSQHMLILAYTRLFLLPERTDGSKLTTIATFGCYNVRLLEVDTAGNKAVPPLWVELYDRFSARVLDSAGCRDLLHAGAATATFLAEAQRLNGIAPSRGSSPD
jgi:hypothetical protein